MVLGSSPVAVIGYVTIEDSKYVKINSVNPLYLTVNKVNGYFEEINGNKYLALVHTNESNENIKKIWKTVERNQRFNYFNNYKLMVMIKNIWKSNLIQMASYLKIKR